MSNDIAGQVSRIVTAYEPASPHVAADELRALWLQFEPKSIEVIKAEQRKEQETVGIPVPILQSIGKEIARVARKRVTDFVPLARLLWEAYGREGRVVTVTFLGPMELSDPETIVPLAMDLCRTCITWEDADQLAMRALEPIVRQNPERWLAAMEPWLLDENKWVRRAGVTVAGRLAMKHPALTRRCLELAERLLFDEEQDVKRAVSFAIRLAARGEIAPVRDLLVRHVPPNNASATWVLCDVIRSMAKTLLPEFASLLPAFEAWADGPSLKAADRRSVESAAKVLRSVQ
ncbi:MAG: DNA alkylation repair protein [Anaerolineae bacterium]|nr:DNA alkylation repair protein [Anaerolineae bacterium]